MEKYELLVHAGTWMNLRIIMLVKPDIKDHIMYDSGYMEYPA